MAGENTWTGKPYQKLGGRLKAARENIKETLAEVSGSVEIDIDTLKNIEIGDRRPSEETLLLLINHFNFSDDEATDLWELAGYGSIKLDGSEATRPLAAIIPLDNRVIYTDLLHVATNNHGVVMNFLQNTGDDNQPLTVARVGMSKEHAQSVLETLQKALEQSERSASVKALPAAATKKHKNR